MVVVLRSRAKNLAKGCKGSCKACVPTELQKLPCQQQIGQCLTVSQHGLVDSAGFSWESFLAQHLCQELFRKGLIHLTSTRESMTDAFIPRKQNTYAIDSSSFSLTILRGIREKHCWQVEKSASQKLRLLNACAFAVALETTPWLSCVEEGSVIPMVGCLK